MELEEDAHAQEVLAWTAVVLWWDTRSSSALLSSRKHLAERLLCSPRSVPGARHSSVCVWAGGCPEGKWRQGKGQGLTAHAGQVRNTSIPSRSCSAGLQDLRRRGTAGHSHGGRDLPHCPCGSREGKGEG